MPEPELNSKFDTWFGVVMTQDPKDPDVFHGIPREGITLTETRYVQNPRAQMKRRGESWGVHIEVSLYSGLVLEASIHAVVFDMDRAVAREGALEKLKHRVEPLVNNLEFLGALQNAGKIEGLEQLLSNNILVGAG